LPPPTPFPSFLRDFSAHQRRWLNAIRLPILIPIHPAPTPTLLTNNISIPNTRAYRLRRISGRNLPMHNILLRPRNIKLLPGQYPPQQYPAHSPYPHQPHVNGATQSSAYAAHPNANAAPRPAPPTAVPLRPAHPNAMQQHAPPPNVMQQRAAPPNALQNRPAPPNTMQHRPNPPSMRPLPPQNSYPARPIPSDVASATAGMQQMNFGPGMTGTSAPYGMRAQGMDAPAVTDPAFCPRPDLSGSAVAVRVSQGDVPVAPPTQADSAAFDPQNRSFTSTAEPSACPPEIFVPASTRCVRLTSGAFPMTMALARKYGLPLGAVIQPLAKSGPGDDRVPVVNFGSSGIVRCRRCRSYVNYTCKFTGGGRHWICTMCRFVNDVPAEYFSPLDARGYPMPPVYLFVLEVTPAAVQSNALAACIAGIKRSIDAMPNEGRTRVGIITFDSSVHFYSLKPGPDPEPCVSVVADISDMFLPTPDTLLAQLDECRPAFEKTLNMISASYSPGQNMQGQSSASCLGAAVQGAKKVLEFSGGRLVLLASSRPTTGPGALNDRADMSLLNTNRERAILRPSISFYRQAAVEMSKSQICCDLFLCPPPPGLYMDVATIAQLAKITGGEIFYAPSFDAPKDAPRLQLAVNRLLAREMGFEAVMRIRATKSVRCTGFSGRFFTRSTDLLAMPGVDSDKAYSVQFTFTACSSRSTKVPCKRDRSLFRWHCYTPRPAENDGCVYIRSLFRRQTHSRNSTCERTCLQSRISSRGWQQKEAKIATWKN